MAGSRTNPRFNTAASRVLHASSRVPGPAGGGGAGGPRYGGGSVGGGGRNIWNRPHYGHSNRHHHDRYRYGHYHRDHYDHHHHHGVNSLFWGSVNYAYRPRYWGYSPWWGSGYSHSWHRGSWNYGWNNHWHRRYAYYRRPAFYTPPGYRTYYTSLIPWGLASWTLGSLAYDTGYYSYYNPYSAPPVTTNTTIIRYAEPITVVASNHQPVDDTVATTAAEKAAAAMDRARAAFQAADYVGAATAVEEAISHTPGDPVLHEFRGLTLFALGRYEDAAGVLHSVLASGPGWDWDTLIGFYGDPEGYTEQFRRLEDYVLGNSEAPAPHLLLGYHYMVGGSLPEAYEMFDRVATLQPKDTVSRQLRALLAESAPESSPELEVSTEAPAPMEADKIPVVAENLHGIWKAPSADGKAITLSLTSVGTFTWSLEGADKPEVLSGEWSIDEDGLLVLKDDDVQIVGDIALNKDGGLHFLLAGSPEDDPGLLFSKE